MVTTEYVLTIPDADNAMRIVKEAAESARLIEPATFVTHRKYAEGWASIRPCDERSEGLLRVALIWNGIPYEAFQPEVI